MDGILCVWCCNHSKWCKVNGTTLADWMTLRSIFLALKTLGNGNTYVAFVQKWPHKAAKGSAKASKSKCPWRRVEWKCRGRCTLRPQQMWNRFAIEHTTLSLRHRKKIRAYASFFWLTCQAMISKLEWLWLCWGCAIRLRFLELWRPWAEKRWPQVQGHSEQVLWTFRV